MQIDIEELKSYLGYEPGDVSRDNTLQLLADAGLIAMRELLGRKLDYGVYKDTYQFRSERHYVIETPVHDILSVESESTIVDPSEYLLFRETGLLHFKNFNTGFPNYRRWAGDAGLFTITYAGGYEELPPDLKLALFSAVQSIDNAQKLQVQYGGPVKRISVYDVGVTEFASGSSSTSSTTVRNLLETLLAPQLSAISAMGTWLLHESEFVGGSPT
jgi:hypothetical protein